MRNVFASIAAILLVSFALPATAQQLQLRIEWDIPTTREDGSPLPANEYGGAFVSWGTVPGGPYPNVADVVGLSMEVVDDPNLEWDTMYCVIVEAYDTDGRPAAPAAEQCVTTPDEPVVTVANPSPATNVRVTVEIV